MDKSVELAIRIAADATGVASSFDGVGDSARRMADDVDTAATTAADAAGRLDKVGAAAEGVDDKAGRATGALGALSSGFELVGLEKYAAGLQGASMATDFFSGASQATNLILETTRGAALKARAATLAQGAATRVTAAATRVWAAGQWLLNAAMTANPIGIVIVAVVALVAIIVVAYKKSETFRNIVQAVMRAVRDAVGWVIDKVQDLAAKVGLSGDKWRILRDAAVSAGQYIRDKLSAAFNAVMKPIDAIIGAVQRVLDLIGRIKIPDIDLPDVNPFNNNARTTAAAPELMVASATTSTTEATPSIDARTYIQVDGALDPAAVGRQVIELIKGQLQREGRLSALEVIWT